MNEHFPPLRFNLGEFLQIHKQRDALEAIMWSVLTIPVAIMAIVGMPNGLDVFSPEGILKIISRFSGLYATQLILIQLILISRIPYLNYLYGHDKLTTLHKKIGKPAYYLLVLHFIAVIQEYVLLQNKSFFAEFLALFNFPDLAKTVVAFGIITVVIFSSLNFVRKRIPYELWFATHLLTYMAILLSFPHQVSMGTDIKGSLLVLGYWWGLYITTVLFIVIFRFGKPVATSLRHQLKVVKVVEETPSVVSIYMTGRNLDKLQHYAGQFYMWKFLT